jgi:DNA-binding CsgD family transcriptional regulator
MSRSPKTRADDERELAMLDLRAAGYSAGAIGDHFGETSSRIRTLTNRIREAHADHTGEPVSDWW